MRLCKPNPINSAHPISTIGQGHSRETSCCWFWSEEFNLLFVLWHHTVTPVSRPIIEYSAKSNQTVSAFMVRRISDIIMLTGYVIRADAIKWKSHNLIILESFKIIEKYLKHSPSPIFRVSNRQHEVNVIQWKKSLSSDNSQDNPSYMWCLSA